MLYRNIKLKRRFKRETVFGERRVDVSALLRFPSWDFVIFLT